ncbi:MAG: DMT family transporter [Desulfovibrionaceae bacterium]
MSIGIIVLILGAAMLHATWNVIVKGGDNKLFETAINALGGGIGAMVFLPFLPMPDPAAWPLLALSCLFHLSYYLCISTAYKIVDLSYGYTIMRGCAPMLTAFALLVLGDSLPPAGWIGVVLLCGGVLTLAIDSLRGKIFQLKGTLAALGTAIVIMCYTLADGYGARASGNGISYTCWIFFLNIFLLNGYVLCRHGKTYVLYLRGRATVGLFGGLCGLGSYGIALWAMTVAPIALVAALRESSVIFGMLMAVFFLGEKCTLARVCAIILVVCGAMVVRLV